MTERGSLIASRYAPARPQAHHLALLVGQGLSAWAATSVQDRRTEALVWAPGEEALDDAAIPRQPASVSFLSLPEWSTLVPDGVLAPGTEARHLALVHGGQPAGVLRDEPLPALAATCIYTHDDRSERGVLKRFPHARPLPLQAVLVQGARARREGRAVLLFHRGEGRLEVALTNAAGGLLLSNSFPARTAQDTLYFLLFATERCGLSPGDVLLVHGGTHLTDIERDLLRRYFPHTAPAATDDWSPAGADPRAPVDRWLAVLDQFACVS